MLEWYRAHGQYELLMDDCMAVMACAAQTAGTRQFTFRDRSASPFAEPERMTVAEAFDRFAGIDLMAALPPEGPDRRRFAIMANEAGRQRAERGHLGRRVQPRAGREDRAAISASAGRPILDEYPAVMSALARPKLGDTRVAERFEIYICGVELANGFGELTDPVEQRRRLAAEMAEKERIYHERYPIDDDFIAALRTMPPACGVALGFDRLVMLATGAQRIDQVMWTPVDVP